MRNDFDDELFTMEHLSNEALKNISYITLPFQQAAKESIDKIVHLAEDVYRENQSGVLLNFMHTDPKISAMYDFFSSGEFTIYFFYNDLYVGYVLGKNNICQKYKILNFDGGKMEKDEETKRISFLSGRVIVMLLFKKYAKIETKTVGANKRYKDINCKYTNDTNSDITFLDSTWFTNLVKSEGFNVRGHFRLQPKKKNGEWTKELIWISEFEKTGYNRKAKKLSYEVQ